MTKIIYFISCSDFDEFCFSFWVVALIWMPKMKKLKHINHNYNTSLKYLLKYTKSSLGFDRHFLLQPEMQSLICQERHTDLGQRAPPLERLRTAQSKSAAISLLRGLHGLGFTTF